MKVKCYSVRFKEYHIISPKAYKATTSDGRSFVIPASQIFGIDFECPVPGSVWMPAWLLESKSIPHTPAKTAWFDTRTRCRISGQTVVKHIPEHKEAVDNNEIADLRARKG